MRQRARPRPRAGRLVPPRAGAPPATTPTRPRRAWCTRARAAPRLRGSRGRSGRDRLAAAARFERALEPLQLVAQAHDFADDDQRGRREPGLRRERGQRAQRTGHDALAALRQRLDAAETVDSVRGIEGEASAVYFRAYGRLVTRHGFTFTTRVRRPPDNPINAMLSFGYVLLTATCASAVRTVGFDAHSGFLHRDRYGRESLALDLCEEFRPVIVDALVAGIVNRRVLKPSDFETDLTGVMLSRDARRRFIELYTRKMAEQVRHPVLMVRVSHERAIELQGRAIAKVLTGEIDRYTPFAKR